MPPNVNWQATLNVLHRLTRQAALNYSPGRQRPGRLLSSVPPPSAGPFGGVNAGTDDRESTMDQPIFEASGSFGGLKFKVFGSVSAGRVGVGISKGVFTFCEFGSEDEAVELARAILAAVESSKPAAVSA